MSGGAVAGKRLRVVDGARIGAAQHGPFHAAMLVAQRDFQMVDRLAVTLEAKMARLDDAGMDRTDGDFMDLFARHLEEVGHAAGLGHLRWCGSCTATSANSGWQCNCQPNTVGCWKSNRLQLGMANRRNFPLLEYFAL